MADIKRIALTVAEAAEAVGVSRTTMNRWTHIQGFPVRRVGGCTRILVDELADWMKNQTGVESA